MLLHVEPAAAISSISMRPQIIGAHCEGYRGSGSHTNHVATVRPTHGGPQIFPCLYVPPIIYRCHPTTGWTGSEAGNRPCFLAQVVQCSTLAWRHSIPSASSSFILALSLLAQATFARGRLYRKSRLCSSGGAESVPSTKRQAVERTDGPNVQLYDAPQHGRLRNKM